MTGGAEPTGLRVLVVGGGSGIGRAVVDAFLGERARVGVLELDPAKCEELRGTPAARSGDLLVVSGDAAEWTPNHAAVDAMAARFDGIDTLIHCVGRFDFYKRLDAFAEDELAGAFEEAFRTNVLSQLVSVHVALPHLRSAGGSVVLTASTSAFMPGRGGVLYVASKFAVRGIVTQLAHELAPDVRVNAVAPGGTLGTDLRGLSALGLDNERLDDSEDRAERLRRRTPLQTALTAADHAACYLFLAGDGAKGMTGTFLHPDGGMAAR